MTGVQTCALPISRLSNQLREGGKDVVPALIEACPVRLRPILMTSAATVAAALPEAIHLGPGSETLEIGRASCRERV